MAAGRREPVRGEFLIWVKVATRRTGRLGVAMGFMWQRWTWLWAAVPGLALTAVQLCAHTLPISYLFVVADAEYVHLELSFNPFELSEFSELDTNHNARLDAEEFAATQSRITRRLLDHLKLKVNGHLVPVESAGLSPDGDTHHATLRAHFKTDARHATLAIESTLQQVTSSSHLTQVNFLRAGRRGLAQLDARAGTATFVQPADARCDPALPGLCVNCRPVSGRGGTLSLAVVFGLVLLLILQRARHSYPRQPAGR